MYNDCILQKNTDRGRLPVTIPGSSYILQYEPSLHGGWLLVVGLTQQQTGGGE